MEKEDVDIDAVDPLDMMEIYIHGAFEKIMDAKRTGGIVTKQKYLLVAKKMINQALKIIDKEK